MNHQDNIENSTRAQMQQGQPMPPRGPMMPPSMMGPMNGPRRTRTWRDRFMRNYGRGMSALAGKGALTIPGWMNGKCIAFFFVALFACWVAFGHVPGVDLIMTACISVVLFFYGGYIMARKWSHTGEKRFLRNIFIAGVLIRLLWVLYCYFFFNPEHYNNTLGSTEDVEWYIPFAKDLAQWLSGNYRVTLAQIINNVNESAIDDVGYPMWLAIGYVIWGDISDIFIPMLIKCVINTYCSLYIFYVAKRHYGEGTARMAAIFVCLNPNMIYWCASMMKEAEMVFLCCLAIDKFDRVLSSGRKYTFKALLPGILAGLALMFFRSVLGIVMFLAVFAHIVMVSRRVMSMGKKVIAGILVAAVLLVSMGNRIRTQSEELLKSAQSAENLERNREFRATREGGNALARYAGTAVFAPLIFTIPFPTFNAAQEGQLVQVQLAGGNYIKNILSFFVILVMVLMLIGGEWRRHVFIIAYTCGYLVVLVLSNYAQSGRFHMPVWPMLMLFAAYGIQLAKENKKLQRGFTMVLLLEVFICLAWNWFKLKGRGMI